MESTINGVDLLPEPLIHHVQSFLTNKEAARTAILSRFWRSAWSTRPQLEFNHSDFRTPGFLDLATATMQRYQDLNLKIDRLTLRTSGKDKKDLLVAAVVKAAELGVAHLSLSFDRPFVLPEELLGFGFGSLVELSLENCRGIMVMNCSNLNSLTLRRVTVLDDVLEKILSSCPLIQKLEFYSCQCSFHEEFSPMNQCRFPNLNSLVLEKMHIHPSFFIDFPSRFPRLKYLCIDKCRMNKRRLSVQNYSPKNPPSMELLTVAEMALATSEEWFDCLSISGMEFSGSRQVWAEGAVGRLDWECSVWMHLGNSFSREVADRLRLLLRILRLSRISLFISVDSRTFSCDLGPFQCVDHRDLAAAVVENLTVHAPSSTLCLRLFHGLQRVLTALRTTCFQESSLNYT